jgi:hypothetical protein
MSEYVKTCKYCKQEIKMSNDSGKWNPYNKDGSAHDCRTTGAEDTSAAKQDTPTYTLDQVVKKLESIGIIINVQRLLSQ